MTLEKTFAHSEADTPKEIRRAMEFFSPENFGFERYGWGYKKKLQDETPLVITPLDWDSYKSLKLLTKIQMAVFKTHADQTSAPIERIAETGGCELVAYDGSVGFNKNGWLGYAIGYGSSDHILKSHMLGVREEARNKGIGWYLKILQFYEALKSGHYSMNWTYDPLRGTNANLNIRGLGGKVNTYFLHKYGAWAGYNTGPTHRFSLEVDLLSPVTHQVVKSAYEGTSSHFDTNITELTQVVPENLDLITGTKPNNVAFEIPSDITSLDKEKKLKWYNLSRRVFQRLLDTKEPIENENDPALSQIIQTRGNYQITWFQSTVKQGVRRNFYILQKKLDRV